MYEKDINKLFTDIVKEYLDKGFVVNARSMSSISSYEICKIDLTDGNGVYRFLLEETHKRYDDPEIYLYVDGIRLAVLYFAEKKPHTRNTHLWEDEGDVIREENFYKMPNRSNHVPKGDGWYTTDFNAVRAAEIANDKRWESRRVFRPFDEYYQYPESVKRNLLPLVRRLPRCKTAHLEDVGDVWRTRDRDGRNVFNITVKGTRHLVYIGKEKSA